MRRWAALVAIATVFGATPALADVTQGDVDDARDRVRRVTEKLAGEVAAYEAAVSEAARLLDHLERLRVQLTVRERDLVQVRRAARSRAAEMYMAAGGSQLASGTSNDVERLPAQNVYLASVAQTDREVVNRLELARRDFEQQRGMVADAVAQQEVLRSEIERLVLVIYEELERVNQEYQAVREEWEAQESKRIQLEAEARQRREFLATSTTSAPTTTRPATNTTPPTAATTTTTPTAPGAATTTTAATATTSAAATSTSTTAQPTTTVPVLPAGTRVCPVDGATAFTDSWGDPRPGGRTHSGTDLLAAEGTPLVAIETGTIYSPGWHSSGGLGLYLRGDSGDTWYYAHLSSYVSGLVGGLRVAAGQSVGFVGHTGNASTPHLHLGWQPGGGSYQNPYLVLAGLC